MNKQRERGKTTHSGLILSVFLHLKVIGEVGIKVHVRKFVIVIILFGVLL